MKYGCSIQDIYLIFLFHQSKAFPCVPLKGNTMVDGHFHKKNMFVMLYRNYWFCEFWILIESVLL